MIIGASSSHRSAVKVWFSNMGEVSSAWMKPFFVAGLNLFLSEGLTATAAVSGYKIERPFA
jgi:hypothetical protein